jgi:hypothetical protein
MCVPAAKAGRPRVNRKEDTYIFELSDLARQSADVFVIVLTLELVQHGGTVLPARVRRHRSPAAICGPGAVAAPGVQVASARRAGVRAKGGVGRRCVAVAGTAAGGAVRRAWFRRFEFRGRGAAVVCAEEVVAVGAAKAVLAISVMRVGVGGGGGAGMYVDGAYRFDMMRRALLVSRCRGGWCV